MKKINNTLLASAIASLLIATTSVSYARGLSFSDMDTDKNGSVSEQEFNTAKAKRIASRAAEGRKMRGLANAPTFADLDTNKDKKLTFDEVQKMQQARGQRGNGMRQGKRGMGRPPQPKFADFDANNDKLLTEQEYYTARNNRIGERAKEGRKMSGLEKMPAFADIDTNADRQVTEAEFGAFIQDHKQKEGRRAGKSQGQGQGNKGMGRPPRPVFSDFDANKDQFLTKKEFYDARNKRIGDRAKEGRKMKGLANIASFEGLDVNKDGKVSKQEFSQFVIKHEKQNH